jgi:hypothetical protein
MTAEQLAPVTWYITAANPGEAIRVLRDAATKFAERNRLMSGSKLDRWPGFEIRVYVSGAPLLLAHERYGKQIHEISGTLTRHGRKAGIRLELQW